MLTERIAPSEMFVKRYGDDFNLIFRMSAKSGIDETQILGPTVFKRDKDVEYSIYLPFTQAPCDFQKLRDALGSLFEAIVRVLVS